MPPCLSLSGQSNSKVQTLNKPPSGFPATSIDFFLSISAQQVQSASIETCDQE